MPRFQPSRFYQNLEIHPPFIFNQSFRAGDKRQLLDFRQFISILRERGKHGHSFLPSATNIGMVLTLVVWDSPWLLLSATIIRESLRRGGGTTHFVIYYLDSLCSNKRANCMTWTTSKSPGRLIGVVLSIGFQNGEEDFIGQVFDVAKFASPDLHYHQLAPG